MTNNHVRSVTVNVAIITVSTTRTKETDSSGKMIIDLLSNAGIQINHYTIIPDRVDAIRDELFTALKDANCIIFNGGTGLTHDDCTVEAIEPLLEKKIDGFGELFRMKSVAEIGTHAMLSRAVAGIISGKAVFCIPGSTSAVTLATRELIIPEITQILSHAGL